MTQLDCIRRSGMDLSLSESIGRCRTRCAPSSANTATSRRSSAEGASGLTRRRCDWQRLLVEHGYAARTIPREYGGFGAEPDVLEAAVIADGIHRRRASTPAWPTRASPCWCRRCWRWAPRSRSAGGSGRPSAARSSGARAIRSPAPAAISRSCRPAACAGRALRRQRPEDLDQLGAPRRHDVPALPHRAGQAEARGHLLSPAVDEDAGHRGAAADAP